ncbi:hypothetical protein GGX14DRAFT_619848, partial [Mycena pura]
SRRPEVRACIFPRLRIRRFKVPRYRFAPSSLALGTPTVTHSVASASGMAVAPKACAPRAEGANLGTVFGDTRERLVAIALEENWGACARQGVCLRVGPLPSDPRKLQPAFDGSHISPTYSTTQACNSMPGIQRRVDVVDAGRLGLAPRRRKDDSISGIPAFHRYVTCRWGWTEAIMTRPSRTRP